MHFFSSQWNLFSFSFFLFSHIFFFVFASFAQETHISFPCDKAIHFDIFFIFVVGMNEWMEKTLLQMEINLKKLKIFLLFSLEKKIQSFLDSNQKTPEHINVFNWKMETHFALLLSFYPFTSIHPHPTNQPIRSLIFAEYIESSNQKKIHLMYTDLIGNSHY